MEIEKKTKRRTLIVSSILVFVVIPVLIGIGIYVFNDRKYLLISVAIIAISVIPFFVQSKLHPLTSRRFVLVASLTAIATLGRIAFFFLPQFKPVTAMVIIAAVVLGPVESFFMGAATGLVSNIYFGQGPWTVWQMYSFGLIGWIAGYIFKKKPKRITICIFGFLSCFCIYGLIMNYASVVMFYSYVTKKTLIAAYIQGIPFDFIHAVATAIFLWFLYPLFTEKLERIKIKYNL